MERILNEYYKDNAKKLRKMSDKILRKFGGVYDKDLQDFYSLSNEVFTDVIKRYDGVSSFEAFLYSCLCNKFKTEMTARHRVKRASNLNCVSIDAPLENECGLTIGDTIQSDFDIEKEAFRGEDEYSENMLAYLGKLSQLQRQVLDYISVGYTSNEIIDALHITKKQYSDCCDAIHSYRNVSVLL